MKTLRQDSDPIERLNGYRKRAIILRDRGMAALNAIAYVQPADPKRPGAAVISAERPKSEKTQWRKQMIDGGLELPDTPAPPVVEKRRARAAIVARESSSDEEKEALENWLGMGNKIEAALLTSVQMNVPLGVSIDPNLWSKIDALDLESVLGSGDPDVEPEDDYERLDRRIRVLVAANAMQVLTSRDTTALSAQTMYCYYAILQELNLAMRPDWTIGAARAGDEGTISAFVTGECMRAILKLERVHLRTAEFMAITRNLNERYLNLQGVISMMDGDLEPEHPQHPLQEWIGKALERMWLDWFISVRNLGDICFPPPPIPTGIGTVESVQRYLNSLPAHLASSMEGIQRHTAAALKALKVYERSQVAAHAAIDDSASAKSPSERAKRYAAERARTIIRTADNQAKRLMRITAPSPPKPHPPDDHTELLKELETQFRTIARSIHRVLDASKRYVEGALGRSMAESETQVDAGEVVFAACSYGAVTSWESSSRSYLHRACATLLKAIPENGMLGTRQPFHSTRRGYKLFPTSCEMIRSLAVLIDKTAYDLDEDAILAVGRLLESIDDRKIEFPKERWLGWNFDGASDPGKPSVWVTCVTVLALERLVRTLNGRINAMVLRHFDVIEPPDTEIDRGSPGLNDLIYSDYGFALHCPPFDDSASDVERTPIALTLEQMRSHLLQVSLRDVDITSIAYSAVLYGPPQTGKTTLAEALAASSGVPLVRLSPFDLMREPEESAESRGRVIFDALAMLTNAVIIFDEFEPVLQGREENHEPSGEFLFLLTGLLPKLVQLHNAAQSQALVFFLATNYINRIDSAAVRRGRFDLQIPVHHADTLSRTAACLYRLQYFRSRARKWPGAKQRAWTDPDWKLGSSQVLRMLRVVENLAGVAPSDLAQKFFRIPKGELDLADDVWMVQTPYFAHILERNNQARMPSPPAIDVHEEDESPRAPKWKREKAWIDRFELSFREALKKVVDDRAEQGAGATDDEAKAPRILQLCLLPPGVADPHTG